MSNRSLMIPAGAEIKREPGEWDRTAWEAARADLKTDCHTSDDKRRWFGVLTEPSCERLAAAFLIGCRIKVYLPMVGKWRRHGVRRTKAWITEPMFPGYLFVRLDFAADDKAIRRVQSGRGINDFMMFGECYAVVSDTEMRKIASASDAGMIKREQSSIWEAGEEVRISDGLFTGFNALINTLEHKGRIDVLLSMFGRLSLVELGVEQIEKL